MSGKKLGLTLAAVAAFMGAYEFFAIAIGPLPTWSRLVQGLRDSSTIGYSFVVVLASAIAITLIAFALWVWKHFVKEHRSEL